MPNNYNKKDIQYKFIGISEITTQNKVGDKIGTLQVYYQNKKLTEMPVYLTEKINFSPLKYFSGNIWIIIPIMNYFNNLSFLEIAQIQKMIYNIINKRREIYAKFS